MSHLRIRRPVSTKYGVSGLRLQEWLKGGENTVRIAIMGSGGVGGYFGAKLMKGGADVTFIARGAHLAAMREQGLAIESTHESFHLPTVKATDDPNTIEPVDLVMFGVKLWDTEAAARQIVPLMGPDTAVISFQ